MPRTIAIGDIHGCAVALTRLLQELAPQKSDTIVGIGDYVDRGLDSNGVIETLVDLVSVCHLVPLIGNHELMMFTGLQNRQDFEFWVQHGGGQTLSSYGGKTENIPQHHMTFLNHCLKFYETDTHIFLHANYVPEIPLHQQPDEVIFWEHIKETVPGPHQSGKTVVVGHTPQSDGLVRNCGHLQIIDTFCYGDGWLTALDVDSGKIWQTNNAGDFRESMLGPPEPAA
ncbi:MAG: metallophosphoesterase [Mariniblastus sp.]|nr:metallophosphoesterase [Mariniblastus sp.]